MPEIDFVLANYGEHGWGVTSPQIPGLVAGAPRLEEITPDYLMSLAGAAGVDCADGFVVFTDEVVVVGEIVFHVVARQMPHLHGVLGAVQAYVRDRLPVDAAMRDSALDDALGERHFVACLRSDELARVARMLGDVTAFVAVVPSGESLSFVRLVAQGESGQTGASDAHTVSKDMTMGEVVMANGGDLASPTQLAYA